MRLPSFKKKESAGYDLSSTFSQGDTMEGNLPSPSSLERREGKKRERKKATLLLSRRKKVEERGGKKIASFSSI